MNFHLVSYATPKYRHRQIFLAASAKANRIVASATSWNPKRLTAEGFLEIAPDLSLAERGSGFWAWKPFIILKALETVPQDDIVLYCDAGRKYPYILLETPLDPFVEWMDEVNQHIMPGIYIPWNGPMSFWTKYDAFSGTGMYGDTIRNAPPIQASFSLWRNNEATIRFVQEWLSWCVQRALVSDDPSTIAHSESPDFKAHRHDQSLLNLCCLKYGVKGIAIGDINPIYNERDPSLILKNVFQSRVKTSFSGACILFASIIFQNIERALRKLAKFGKRFE